MPRDRTGGSRSPQEEGRDFRYRPLVESDIPLLAGWLTRPHVKEWWPSPDALDDLRREYLPEHSYGEARPFLAYLDEKPFGYIQYYVVAEGDPGWWPDRPPNGTVGIDQFIACETSLGKGFGTSMIEGFVRLLFEDPGVRQIRVDPHPENRRAVNCYRRVGFRTVGPITTPDGPAVLMTLDRS